MSAPFPGWRPLEVEPFDPSPAGHARVLASLAESRRQQLQALRRAITTATGPDYGLLLALEFHVDQEVRRLEVEGEYLREQADYARFLHRLLPKGGAA